MARIAIAGAGLLGRLLAWQLGHAGHEVAVFDPAPGPEPTYDGHGAAAFSAAGMLSPTAELDRADAAIAALGWRSIPLWRDIVEGLGAPGLLKQRGSLLLAHRADRASAQRVLARLQGARPAPQALGAEALATLEPALHGAASAWLLPQEAQIDPPATLCLLQRRAAASVDWHWRSPVAALSAGRLQAGGRTLHVDWVFDTRGLGARSGKAEDGGFATLRGVRGETVWLQAPAHGLTRPVRLLHPRHAVYLLPRGADRVFVGASEIESEDRSPVSLRSSVELMAAAHSVMPALAEARIERLDRNLRPAWPDHQPGTEVSEGLVRINGLFRHGWLMAPALVQDALARAGLKEALHA
ncbi:FAD-dependent oxidoreductase [Xylophilus rhododendri]|uniref:FAD-dependent oxidoreductase n=1 Tax=Xylophilus rhododendri TaxID=2697032 RepID=A0A857J8E9_9BURK|nr:FAD-dependent oxidoreductase [Xylophilus rhododendri]QHI99292.1 FAD-dependent oxidoreductase [Xylophilus rhododendri]